jgi:hypothetical protein
VSTLGYYITGNVILSRALMAVKHRNSRLDGHEAMTGEMRKTQRICSENEQLEDREEDGNLILRRFLGK